MTKKKKQRFEAMHVTKLVAKEPATNCNLNPCTAVRWGRRRQKW